MMTLCHICKYKGRPIYADPCCKCEGLSKFKEKEGIKMSKVTIEYKEVERPIKKIIACGIYGNKITAEIFEGKLSIDTSGTRLLDKETSNEFVQALNELIKQL